MPDKDTSPSKTTKDARHYDSAPPSSQKDVTIINNVSGAHEASVPPPKVKTFG